MNVVRLLYISLSQSPELMDFNDVLTGSASRRLSANQAQQHCDSLHRIPWHGQSRAWSRPGQAQSADGQDKVLVTR